MDPVSLPRMTPALLRQVQTFLARSPARVQVVQMEDVLGVREAKDQLSSLLQRAATGEEIVITSDGVPTAMIVRYKPVIRGKPFQPNLALLRSMPTTSDSTPAIRAERDSGP